MMDVRVRRAVRGNGALDDVAWMPDTAMEYMLDWLSFQIQE
jgi:hypothetical protein